MKQKNLKTLTAMALVLCMVLAMSVTAFAQAKVIFTTTSSFVRDSNTKGTVSVHAVSANPDTPYVKSKITLQEAPLGTTTFTDSNVTPKTKTSNSASVTHVVSFTISTKKEYRAKIQITDNTNGIDSTLTFYEDLQE